MSDKKEKMIISGFVFENAAEAEQAQKEAAGVKFIKEKVDMDNPEMVLQVYNKAVRQKLFETAVGFSYLKELQKYLQNNPLVRQDAILPIEVQHPILESQYRRKAPERVVQKTTEKAANTVTNIDYKSRYRFMSSVAGILIICVIAMFVIAATANNPTILNYEQEIINKYAVWEEQLDAREAVVQEREAELGIDNE